MILKFLVIQRYILDSHLSSDPGPNWPTLFIAVVGAIVAAAGVLINAWPLWKNKRRRDLLEKAIGTEIYSIAEINRATQFYIPQHCTSVDPSFEAEIRQILPAREYLFNVLDRFLTPDSHHKHLLVLADSGMGKTACLLNYLARNRALNNRKRMRIALIPLGLENPDADILTIENPRQTVLFLDAFDEDVRAINDHRARLSELMQLCSRFRKVVVTCRTQFFTRDEEIPLETGIARIEPRQAGEPGVIELQKIYLAPFTKSQVRKYVSTRFPIWKLFQRVRVTRIVNSIPLLTARPMLLAHIPDLIERTGNICGSYDLYCEMVSAWAIRESRWVNKKHLLEFSQELAIDIFDNLPARGTDRLPLGEITQLASKWDFTLADWQLSGRSLLNRDAEGNYKFAHRSIMEFFIVKAFMEGIEMSNISNWTDQMHAFMQEIVRCKVLTNELLSIQGLDSICEGLSITIRENFIDVELELFLKQRKQYVKLGLLLEALYKYDELESDSAIYRKNIKLAGDFPPLVIEGYILSSRFFGRQFFISEDLDYDNELMFSIYRTLIGVASSEVFPGFQGRLPTSDEAALFNVILDKFDSVLDEIGHPYGLVTFPCGDKVDGKQVIVDQWGYWMFNASSEDSDNRLFDQDRYLVLVQA